jgi:PAS domain S-box-containing protein
MTGSSETEAQLRENEARLQAAIDGGGLGTWDLDLRTGVAMHSARHDQIWGYEEPQREWSLEIAIKHVLPEDVPIITAAYERALESGVLAHENRIVWPDGTVRWIAVNGRVRYDSDGKPAGITGVVGDVTDRKVTEHELRASEARFRALADSMPQLAWIAGADGSISWYNRRWYEYTGTSAGETEGWRWQDLHAPGELPAVLERWEASILSGEAFEMTFPLRGADGRYRDFLTRASPVKEDSGEVGQWVGTNTDVTAMIEAEAALRESAERIRLATAATGVGIWEWDLATDQVHWDAEMFRIYGIEAVPGGIVPYSTWSNAVLPADLAAQEAVLRQKAPPGTQNRREFRIRRAIDGEVRHIQAVETRRADKHGDVQAIVGTNLDVTDRKLAEERLRHLATQLSDAHRRKDEFLSTLAHELRNPLAPIRNGLQILKLAQANLDAVPGEVGQTHEMIERQLMQLVQLVDDLMDMSRISTGKLNLKLERVSLSSVIGAVVESSHATFEQLGQELVVTLPGSPIFVKADATRLAQVFLNLLNNASKYSEPGARIELGAHRDGREVVVRVRDPGIGIPSHMLESIFEIFTQVDRSLEKSHGGLGIGLSLVKRLVALHGGSVEARSEGPGRGSEFTVRLPVVVPPRADTTQGMSVGDPAHSTTPCRILVADDNEDAATSLATLLGLFGHELRTASDGLEAVEAAAAFRPEVVMMDIGMPKLNGYDACRRIREAPWGRDVLMIALTGWGQEEDKRRSQEAGFDHHLVKPVDTALLVKLVASCNSPAGE